MLGPQAGKRNKIRSGGVGYAFLHHAIDDHSRLAYSEILDDERDTTAAAFWARTQAFFVDAGIQVTAVMTDNGNCYRSRAFAAALGDTIRHVFTRPYRPQTNGKVERFNRTLATEWAYAAPYRSDAARAADYPAWIHHYNHHPPHTESAEPRQPPAFTTSRGRTPKLVRSLENTGNQRSERHARV
jgi:transposase InsO family protein